MIKARILLPCFLAGVFILSTSSGLVASPDDSVNKTLVWPDGTRYVGEVREGKRWGKGTIFWKDGTRFIGTFANDLRNGPGTMILPDGAIYSGYFEDDALVDTPSNNNIPAPNEIVPTAETVDVTIIDTLVNTAPKARTVSVSETSNKKPSPVPETVAVPLNLNVSELTDDVRVDLESMIDLWAAAWSDKNVVQYLAYYSDEFKVSGKQSRRQWEALRKSRIQRPKSNIFSDRTRKQFILKKEGELWEILSEQSI